ncbi:hypothetical protein ACFLU5_02760 [Bacteroidota bacterium]
MPAHIEDCRNNPTEYRFGIVKNKHGDLFYYDKYECSEAVESHFKNEAGYGVKKQEARALVTGCPVEIIGPSTNPGPIWEDERYLPVVKIKLDKDIVGHKIYNASLKASFNTMDPNPPWGDPPS